jgi:hypothetical protein
MELLKLNESEADMRRKLLVGIVIVLLAFPSVVKADVAPPAQPPGANPLPGSGTTEVRMMAETVLINIQAKAPAHSLAQALVSADFTMRNLGTAAESMAVRFPVGASDGWGKVPEISNFKVSMDGKDILVRRITGEDPNWGSGEVPWVEFDAAFLPGEDVNIKVTYTLEAAGEGPFIWFNYIFSTGAGWKDAIGSADLTVRFPYDVNEQNTLINLQKDFTGTNTGGVITGKEVKWHFVDFEPQKTDNFHIDLVAPAVWTKILDEEAYLKQAPSDGETWGMLGKLYKEILFSSHGRRGFRGGEVNLDAGGRVILQNSIAAYEKAVTLKPTDPLWHAGFADLLEFYAYYQGMAGTDTRIESMRALKEIQSALALAPDDAKVLEIADEMTFLFPDGMQKIGDTYTYPWLTATPLPPTPDQWSTTIAQMTAQPNAVETATVNPVQVPTPTRLPTTTPAPKKGLPICGSVILIPFGMLVLLRVKSKRSCL